VHEGEKKKETRLFLLDEKSSPLIRQTPPGTLKKKGERRIIPPSPVAGKRTSVGHQDCRGKKNPGIPTFKKKTATKGKGKKLLCSFGQLPYPASPEKRSPAYVYLKKSTVESRRHHSPKKRRADCHLANPKKKRVR